MGLGTGCQNLAVSTLMMPFFQVYASGMQGSQTWFHIGVTWDMLKKNNTDALILPAEILTLRVASAWELPSSPDDLLHNKV